MKTLILLGMLMLSYNGMAQHYYFNEKTIFYNSEDDETFYENIELHINLTDSTLMFSDDGYPEPITECRGEGNRFEYLTEYGLLVMYMEGDGSCSFIIYMPIVGAKKILYRQNKIAKRT